MSFAADILHRFARESLAENQISRAATLNTCAEYIERLEQTVERQKNYIEKQREANRPKSTPHTMPKPGSEGAKYLDEYYARPNQYSGD